jgi:hypothetical protein
MSCNEKGIGSEAIRRRSTPDQSTTEHRKEQKVKARNAFRVFTALSSNSFPAQVEGENLLASVFLSKSGITLFSQLPVV